jgi:hypothetical protein
MAILSVKVLKVLKVLKVSEVERVDKLDRFVLSSFSPMLSYRVGARWRASWNNPPPP